MSGGILFLTLANDVAFDPPEQEYCELVLAVSRGEIEKEGVTELIRRFAQA
jgi:hypothetical protein